MPPTGSRGLVYVRVSADRQDHQRQVEDVQRYLLKHRLHVVETVEDSGSRLEAEKRADFQRLRKKVENKEVDWVLIQTVDRLGFKHTLEFFSFLWEFRKSGVELWSAIEDRNLADIDDGSVFRNAVAGQTSARELFEKANRSQSSRVVRGKQGKYLGGPPPYGFDVVCFQKSGKEVWRYVVHGRAKGTQHFPDGVVVNVGGVPHHNKEVEDCYLRPSIVTERVDTVKWLFDEFDRSAVSSLTLAKTLNNRGVSAVYTAQWKHDTIWRLLQNSVVIGKPAANKVTSAKLLEYKNGELTPRQPGDGFERRSKDQWLLPETALFDPVVPEDQYWRVLEKIVGSRAKRAPKNAELWLAGLVACARCGVNMRGAWKEDYFGGKAQGTYKAHYFCTTRHNEGADNATGCRSFGVRQINLEPYVNQFLEERGQALDALLSSSGDRQWIAKLLEERRDAGRELQDLYKKMAAWIRDMLDSEGASSLVSVPDDHAMLEDMYMQLFDHQTKALQARLRALEEKHAGVMSTFFALPPRAQKAATAQLHEIEAEMEVVEKDLEPLANLVESKRLQWSELGTRIREAKKAIVEGELREKAEAVRRAISRIECHFDHVGPRGSKLVKVVIFPALEGVPSEVTNDGSCLQTRIPYCLNTLLVRVFRVA